MIKLSRSKKIIPKKNVDKILFDLKEKNYIYIYHDLSHTSKTYILLEEKTFLSLTQAEEAKNLSTKKINVSNQYMFLLNLLNIYDTISTYGLFLTKRNEFRKIDRIRLAKSMHKISDIDGRELKSEDLFQLSIFILFMQNSLKIKKDSVIVSLKNIENELEEPADLLFNIINLFQESKVDNPLFFSPFQIPSFKDIQSVIKSINKHNEFPYSYLKITHLLKPLSELRNSDLSNIYQRRKKIQKQFSSAMKFLCITGIIEIENSIVRLSDIGKNIAAKLQKSKGIKSQNYPEQESDIKKIYINPDFTLIIPKKELPSGVLYHILTHTDIVKDDVILYARISRDSILRAYKRGMSKDRFLSELKKYSKIDVPQNLEFMINEWAHQTIKLDVIDATLITSNHSSFIDEISYSEIKSCILERLSPNYAIIDRKYLDKIIKLATKSDAVITLFDEKE